MKRMCFRNTRAGNKTKFEINLFNLSENITFVSRNTGIMFNFFSRKTEPQPLWFSTDIHCHVLPGIDDGSPDVTTSVELVERMQQWGIHRIIASPHVTFGTFPNTPETTAAARTDLQKALDERGNTLELSNAAEYRIDDLFYKEYEAGRLMTLPGNRLLIENSFMQEPWGLEQLVFDLQVKGFAPILVHPERYPYYYKHRDRYKTLHDAGAAFQINVLSLAGHYGPGEKKMAEWLIDQNYVDYIGTDLHRKAHADAIDRYLASKDYVKHRAALEGRTLNDSI